MPRRISGFYIIALMLIITFLAGLVLRYSTQLTNTSEMQAFKSMANQSYFSALSALEVGTFILNSPELASTNAYETRQGCASFNSSFNLSNNQVSLSSVDYRDASTKLTTAISSTASIIPVESLNGFAAQGRIVLNRETIDYFGTSNNNSVCNGYAPCFIYLKRGLDGGSAKSHATNSVVAQYQCTIEGKASSPSHANPKTERTLRQTVQLQKAWIGGQKQSSSGFINSWNGITWETASGIPKENINGIEALSYADVRAVGNKGTILHFNGSDWVDNSLSSNEDLLGISCPQSDNCWTVGDKGKFYYYNGSSWSFKENQGNKKINAVHCPSSTFCWAVGNNGYVYRFPAVSGNDQWSQHDSPVGSILNDVYCLSSQNCWAVGDSEVILKWDGTIWSVASDSGTKKLHGITCTSSSNCWAVGAKKHFWHYNGSNWTLTTPSEIPDNDYYDVVCYRSNDCWAVGKKESGDALIVHWNGSDWSQMIYSSIPSEDIYAIAVIGSRSYSAILNDDVIR